MDKVQTAASVTSTLSASYGILMDNPVFIILAVVSGLAGLWNAIVDLSERGQLNSSISSINVMVTGAFVGVVAAPMTTVILILLSDSILDKYFGLVISSNNLELAYFVYSVLGLVFGRKVVFTVLRSNWGRRL